MTRVNETPLPLAQCRLDLPALRRQRDRYRRIGRQVTRAARRPSTLEVGFDADVDEPLLAETLAIERRCCPFFRLDYDSAARRLSVSVEPGHEPALDAIEHALGLDPSTNPAG